MQTTSGFSFPEMSWYKSVCAFTLDVSGLQLKFLEAEVQSVVSGQRLGSGLGWSRPRRQSPADNETAVGKKGN